MLDFSFGEFVVIVGFATYLVGKRDLPVLGRHAGRGMGRAVGYLVRLRQTAESVTSGNHELLAIQQEVSRGYEQFSQVRSEVASLSQIRTSPVMGVLNRVAPKTVSQTAQPVTEVRDYPSQRPTEGNYSGHRSSTAQSHLNTDATTMAIHETASRHNTETASHHNTETTAQNSETIVSRVITHDPQSNGGTQASKPVSFQSRNDKLVSGADILLQALDQQELMRKYETFVRTGKTS